MKKIISYLLFKCLQIFLPFFFIVLAVIIGLAPLFISINLLNGYIFLLLIITIPVAIVIITLVNKLTDWDNLGEFMVFKCIVSDYKNEKKLQIKNKLEAKNTIYDNEPGETIYDEGGHADYHHSAPKKYK